MEQNILTVLADNPSLLEAVKAHVLKKFEVNNLSVGSATNVELGEIVRACVDGRVRVEDAFNEISRYKTREMLPTSVNPAR